MPRYTVQKAVEKIGGRYDLVQVAAIRAKELASGLESLVPNPTGPCVTALREIEAGLVGRDYLNKLRKGHV